MVRHSSTMVLCYQQKASHCLSFWAENHLGQVVVRQRHFYKSAIDFTYEDPGLDRLDRYSSTVKSGFNWQSGAGNAAKDWGVNRRIGSAWISGRRGTGPVWEACLWNTIRQISAFVETLAMTKNADELQKPAFRVFKG